jgi:D-alanine-D-alanine ligase
MKRQKAEGRRQKSKRVVLLVDREQRVAGDPALTSEAALRHAPMEFYIAKALRELRHDVVVIPALSGKQLVAALGTAAPDVVFNATEHMFGRRDADIQIPALLELLRLPYTGASSASLLRCRDKAFSKSVAEMIGVRVPPFALVGIGEEVLAVPPFPVVVKPVSRDSSEGVSIRSFVSTRSALERQVKVVHRRYRDAAIIEAFIEGIDVYVTAIEGRTLQLRAPQQLRVNANGARSMATYHVKHDLSYRKKWGVVSGPAKLDAKTRRELDRAVRRLWPALQLRDYGRIDFRLTPEGELYFIEANANPGFSPVSRSDSWKWDEYRAAVKTVVSNAAQRAAR